MRLRSYRQHDGHLPGMRSTGLIRRSCIILLSFCSFLALLSTIHSYNHWTILTYSIPSQDSIVLHNWLGRIEVLHNHYASPAVDVSGFSCTERSVDLPGKRSIILRNLFGFSLSWKRSIFGVGDYWSAISVPLWTLILGFAAYPLSVLLGNSIGRRRNRRLSWCLKCGYDLTGNTTGICPECGTKVDRPAIDLRHGGEDT